MLAFALEFDRAPIDRTRLCEARYSLTFTPFKALDLRYLAANIQTLHCRVTSDTWSIGDHPNSRARIIKDKVIRPAEALSFKGRSIWYIMDTLCTYSEYVRGQKLK
jgi:hypothetical protein